jgi:hypothetical protein
MSTSVLSRRASQAAKISRVSALDRQRPLTCRKERPLVQKALRTQQCAAQAIYHRTKQVRKDKLRPNDKLRLRNKCPTDAKLGKCIFQVHSVLKQTAGRHEFGANLKANLPLLITCLVTESCEGIQCRRCSPVTTVLSPGLVSKPRPKSDISLNKASVTQK